MAKSSAPTSKATDSSANKKVMSDTNIAFLTACFENAAEGAVKVSLHSSPLFIAVNYSEVLSPFTGQILALTLSSNKLEI